MSKKTTFDAVAKRAGVGIATVDRVLNERGGVSNKMHRRVIEAARELGVNRILPRGNTRSIRIEVILNRPELPFISRMNSEFARLAQNTDREIIIQRTMLNDEQADKIAQALRSTIADTIILYAKSSPQVIDTINQVEKRGVRVITMISDVPESNRTAYAGMNHVSAGQTAGFFLSHFSDAPKRYLILCDHISFYAHQQRIQGFRNFVHEHAGAGEILEILEGGDDRNQTELLLREAFRRHQNISGIYNVGGANLGVEAAILGHNFEKRPHYIGHELTVHTHRLLRENIMSLSIDQNPEQQSQYALDLCLHFAGYQDLLNEEDMPKHSIPFTIYTSQNIPQRLTIQ